MSDGTDGRGRHRFRPPNPVRLIVLWIGLGLARAGVIDRQRAVETTELAWPRIVTGIARMSKNAVDVALVGIAIGTTAVAGVGLAGPFWGAAFAIGGGVAGGTIALVSQRYGADAHDDLGLAVRASTVLAIALTLPVSALFWLAPHDLISLLSNDPAVIEYGARYLRIVGFGVPLAALNLVGSRVLVGADDAYSAMLLRASGALVNIVLSAALIFGLDMGVRGAAFGTVLSNVVVTAAFAIGLSRGRLPGIGSLPVQISITDSYVDLPTLRDLIDIGLPVGLRNGVWVAAEFPMLLFVGLYGDSTLAAFVIARRIWGIMNAPGWGFGLASSSLVGQSLGANDEQLAEAYGRDIVRFAVATYAVSAVLVALSADRIVVLFADDPSSPALPIATKLVYAACLAIVFQGVAGASAGPLDASGDTRVPFLSQLFGMACVSIPLAYLGATTDLGLWGLYLAFLAETSIPATINYWRFRTNKWKQISEAYRPDTTLADD